MANLNGHRYQLTSIRGIQIIQIIVFHKDKTLLLFAFM